LGAGVGECPVVKQKKGDVTGVRLKWYFFRVKLTQVSNVPVDKPKVSLHDTGNDEEVGGVKG
jgi:hypothetical protein